MCTWRWAALLEFLATVVVVLAVCITLAMRDGAQADFIDILNTIFPEIVQSYWYGVDG
ncbi:hypothetical protein KC19_VG121200 [Ceratodon purpureus]|uniref:Uncharacterized protein n=1 Tax=Ceratodon purpureus TaxID=3225 RepID=A0A8T0HPH4_CERPU|nr:hypothetical protein KC19_VG121200 [Ceratodon purpureus]